MKAAQYLSPGRVELVEIAVPECRPGELLVRVEAVGLCGSDLSVLYNTSPEHFPLPPGVSGHECVGVVVQSPSLDFIEGDRVLILPPQTNALAEYVAVEPRFLIPLPPSLDMETAVLGQPLGTVLFCCRRLDPILDKIVVVIGQGPIGLLFTALLSASGAREVIGLDVVPHRLKLSRRMGATHTIDVTCTDVIEAVREVTDGKMADVVVEAVGEPETINLAPDLARVRGELILFGIPKQPVFSFNYANFFRKYLRTTTTANAQGEPGLRSFRLALNLIAQHRLDVSPLISHRFSFEDVSRAFDLAKTKQDGAAKVLLIMNREIAL